MKKLIAFICVILIIFSASVNVCAKEALYEKYSYDENFEYENEYIAHVLKSTVVKIVLDYSVNLEYYPVSFNEEYLYNLINYLYYTEGYSTEVIALFLDEDLRENTVDYLKFDNKKTILSEGTYVGSGAVISEDGYIATNSHVVALDESGKKDLYLEI